MCVCVCVFDTAKQMIAISQIKRMQSVHYIVYSLRMIVATEKGRICHYPFGTKTKVCLQTKLYRGQGVDVAGCL